MKKTLSLLLALVLVLGSFTSVFAAMPETDVEVAELLQELGILLGNASGDLMLDKDLKRAEAVVLLSRLMKAEDTAKEFSVDDLPFDDIASELYQHYVAWAYANGYAAGKSATKFDPEGDLTAQQFATFLLRALGYEIDAEAYKNAFETAKELGLFEGLNLEKETVLKRKDMARMTFNALYVPMNGEEVTLGEYLELELPQEEPEFAIKEVKATKANELTITFANPVNKDDVKISVTRGSANVAGELKWESETVAVYTTTAKMTNGTYTVEATLKVEDGDDIVATGSTEVVSQFVNQIVILNDVALTGAGIPEVGGGPAAEGIEAYVYYDVLDQYGESLRTTTNITWSASVKANADRTTGRIVLKRTDGKAFTYGEQIFLSGVDTKTGVNVTKTLTVGQAQALNNIKVAGFVKKGTTEILKVLPSGFKAGTYDMVFTLEDQNGNPYTVNNYSDLKEQIAFVSDNPLVISEVSIDSTGNAIVIDGVEYYTAAVKPGLNVDRGGEVNILVIATKTGNKTTINTVVGENQILTSFELLQPTDIIADGESIEIPFKAYDQHGEEIKNFTTIARHESFNALTLTASDSTTLTLSEKADGTAKLTFTDKTMNWSDPQTTDGHDRMVSLTSIVVGGNTSNLMLNIQDKARPMGIKSVDIDNVLVHKDTTKVELVDDGEFEFVDQYGRDMDQADAVDFFNANFAGHNRDFDGYTFAIRATYKGGNNNYSVTGNLLSSGTITPVTNAALVNDAEYIIKAGESLTLAADKTEPSTAVSGMSMRFDIVKFKSDNVIEGVSPVKTEPLTIINIKQVRSIEIKEIDKLFIPTTQTAKPTGEGLTIIGTDGKYEAATPVTIPTAHQKAVEVTGKYNNETVKIPTVYVKPSTPATGVAIKLQLDNDLNISAANDLYWKDLYDISTARYTRKDAEATITVDVFDSSNNKITTASRVVTFSDAEPVLTTIKGSDTWTATPTLTEITNIDSRFKVGGAGKYKYLDQYGVAITPDYIRYRVSSVVENADGYAPNNFSYTGNDTPDLKINGAERGDKFVITILASKDGITVTKSVEVTVGADTASYITSGSAGNNYVKVLVEKLEEQRLQGLGLE